MRFARETIIIDHGKSPPHSIKFGASGNQGDSEGQISKYEQCSKDVGKATSKDQVVFSPANTASSWSKPSCCEEHGTGCNQRGKGVSRTPCAVHASVDCRSITW